MTRRYCAWSTCVRLETDPGLSAAFPRAQGAEIELRLDDGSAIVERLDDVVAATPDEVRERFRAAAAVVLGSARAAEIEDRIDDLETSDDVGALLRLAAAEAPPGRTRRADPEGRTSGLPAEPAARRLGDCEMTTRPCPMGVPLC